jgi:hypothetical protein
MKPFSNSFRSDLVRVVAEVAPINVGLCLLGSVRTAKDPVSDLSELIRTYPAALKALEFMFLLKGEQIPDADAIALRAKEKGILSLICKRDLRDYTTGFLAGMKSDF